MELGEDAAGDGRHEEVAEGLRGKGSAAEGHLTDLFTTIEHLCILNMLCYIYIVKCVVIIISFFYHVLNVLMALRM